MKAFHSNAMNNALNPGDIGYCQLAFGGDKEER